MSKQATLYNLQKLSGVDDHGHNFIRDIVQLFLKTIPSDSEQLLKGCEEKDWDRVYFYAHKMKASIDLLGIEKIKTDIRLVEQYSKGKTHLDKIEKHINLIYHTIQDCAREMKQNFK